MRLSAFGLATMIACAGCTSAPAANPVMEAFAASQHEPGLGNAMVFRFSTRQGSRPTLHRLPTLEAGQLRVETQPGALRTVVGFVADRDVIYVITAGDELMALDLTTGRFRVVDSGVVAGAIGPTGTPFALHTDGSVSTIGLKSVTPWPAGFEEQPTEIFGAVRERLIAVMQHDSTRHLVLAASGQPSIEQPLPRGKLHVSAWGDAVLVATDSGIVFLDPAEPDDPGFLPVDPPLFDADFSASGHRIHVIRRDGVLQNVDRFSKELVAEVALGEVPRAWRVDPWGRYLLMQGGSDGRVLAVDAITLEPLDSIDGEWDHQLPRAAPDGSVLVFQEDQVVVWTPGAGDPTAALAVADRESTRWLIAPWDAARPLESVAEEGEPEPAAPGQELFVQVSTTTNADWAADLAANLRRAGMPASVLAPEQQPDPYRVVLGPYRTREEAEATGRELRLPFWIFARDSSTTAP